MSMGRPAVRRKFKTVSRRRCNARFRVTDDWQIQFSEKRAEAAVVAQTVEARVHCEKHEPSGALVVTPLEPLENSFITQAEKNQHLCKRGNVPVACQFDQFFENPVSLLAAARKRISAPQGADGCRDATGNHFRPLKTCDGVFILSLSFATSSHCDECSPEIRIEFQRSPAFGLCFNWPAREEQHCRPARRYEK